MPRHVTYALNEIALLSLVATASAAPPQCAPTALEFANDVVWLPTNVFHGLHDFTFECWVRPEASSPPGGDPTIVSCVAPEANLNSFAIQVRDENGPPNFLLDLPPDNEAVSFGPSTSFGTWYHVAVVRQGATARTYVNGIPSETFAASTAPLNVGGAAIGQELDCSAGCFDLTQALWGSVDEIRVWNVARTAQQIAAKYNRPLTGDETGLIGYWPVAEGTGQSVFDWSANPHTLTLGQGQGDDDMDPAWAQTGVGLNCSPCPWDTGGFEGEVDAADFLALLGHWGTCPLP